MELIRDLVNSATTVGALKCSNGDSFALGYLEGVADKIYSKLDKAGKSDMDMVILRHINALNKQIEELQAETDKDTLTEY